MTLMQFPKLPLPPPLMGGEVGSFAYFTVIERLPAIARRSIAENNFPIPLAENLEKLAQEIPEQPIRNLAEKEAPDLAAWANYVKPYLGKNWLDVPWYFAEAYFYRRILEATQYFQPGKWQSVDPYSLQKRLGLEKAKNSIQALSTQVNKLQVKWDKKDLEYLLYLALWGNRVDLSLWPANEGDRSSTNVEQEITRILANDAPAVAEIWANSRNLKIDFIIDNAGFELFCDLCLAEFLLSSKIANLVRFHLKAHPTFVSDAMRADVDYTLKDMAANQKEEVRAIACRIQEYIHKNCLQLYEDFFWTSPLAFWEIPQQLRLLLAEANWIIIKGDANYRRLLGDRHWEFTTPFTDIVSYFPAPLVALRTLKSELAAGLHPLKIEKVSKQDSDWLTNGKWGVIQMLPQRT
ncbi:MAG: damage-control phosphatase ARMT1 family protein [Oscillatoriaceae bacterium SKW80]|nr:damage-control phosphatase ARMT1 family protein [Oscillatoriaceae bacterium SKYG93]MCX8119231.1 damage-control phosphatase ARMT1 family protein [Oscillatoriaceae bacterium SKW80]MDW8454698.1 damage-control phosphatase ARMT1 family protein [Oscillatoriaceae cyanobacterium SKYGB_i_bin93]HIK28520.1 protein-glutamate O-methyltransferase family protein [Oscillatoriaceae cyanobacterium M7585_C2015_266]